ncbi:hypothetical protein BJX65DRAFT_263000 [Aspergillus insuetus]
MSCLLDLPVEILTLIISEVLFTPRAAPECPLTTDRVAVHLLYKPTKTRVHHEQRGIDITTLSTKSVLLLTCRQLHDVTKALVALPHSITYHLDLAILNGADQVTDIIATWLCLPKLTNCIEELYISVRSFAEIRPEYLPLKIHTYDDDLVEIYNNVFSWYEYNPTYEAWSIYSLMPRILRFGPLFGVHEPEVSGSRSAWAVPSEIDRKLGVQRLTVDFSSAGKESLLSFLSSSSSETAQSELTFPPADVSYEWWWLWVHGKMPTPSRTPTPSPREACGCGSRPFGPLVAPDVDVDLDLSNYKPRPEWLARRLRDEIQTFLRFARGKEGYATLLGQRFGTVRILVEGRLYWEVDIGNVLGGIV